MVRPLRRDKWHLEIAQIKMRCNIRLHRTDCTVNRRGDKKNAR